MIVPADDGGMPVALSAVTQVLKSRVWIRRCSGVDSDAWTIAAVSIVSAGVLDRGREVQLHRNVPQQQRGSQPTKPGTASG